MCNKLKKNRCDLSDAIIRDVQNTDGKLCYRIVDKQTYDLIANLLTPFPRGIDDIIMTYTEFIVVDFSQGQNKIIDIDVIITEPNKTNHMTSATQRIEFNTGNHHMIVYGHILVDYNCYYYCNGPIENMYYKPDANAVIYGDVKDRKFTIHTRRLQSQQVILLKKGEYALVPGRRCDINEKIIMLNYHDEMKHPAIPDSIMKIIMEHGVDDSCYYGVYLSLNKYLKSVYDTVIKIKKDSLMDDELYEYLYKQIYVTFKALLDKFEALFYKL